MPDFTIIGDDLTKKIESEVRSKYSDISSFEDLEYLGMKNELDELKRYEQKITEDLQKEGGVNSLTNKEIRKKVNQAFQSTVEKCIQDEITDRINSFIKSIRLALLYAVPLSKVVMKKTKPKCPLPPNSIRSRWTSVIQMTSQFTALTHKGDNVKQNQIAGRSLPATTNLPLL